MLLRASEHNMQDRKEDGEQEEENGVGLGRVAPSSCLNMWTWTESDSFVRPRPSWITRRWRGALIYLAQRRAPSVVLCCEIGTCDLREDRQCPYKKGMRAKGDGRDFLLLSLSLTHSLGLLFILLHWNEY